MIGECTYTAIDGLQGIYLATKLPATPTPLPPTVQAEAVLHVSVVCLLCVHMCAPASPSIEPPKHVNDHLRALQLAGGGPLRNSRQSNRRASRFSHFLLSGRYSWLARDWLSTECCQPATNLWTTLFYPRLSPAIHPRLDHLGWQARDNCLHTHRGKKREKSLTTCKNN